MSFFHVQLYYHALLSRGVNLKRMQYLLIQHNIVSDLASQDKTTMFMAHQFLKNRFHLVDHYLRDDLVANIAKTNWSELRHALRVGIKDIKVLFIPSGSSPMLNKLPPSCK